MRKFIKTITESETITEISQDLKDRYVSKSLDSIPTSSPKNMSKRINGVNKAYGSDAAVPENNVVQETMKFLLDALQSKYKHIGTNDALVGDYEIFKINDELNLWISPRDSLHNRGGKKFLWMRLLTADNKAVFTQKFAFSSVKAPQEMLNKLTFVLNAALKNCPPERTRPFCSLT